MEHESRAGGGDGRSAGRRAAGRGAATFADQAVSSLTNFGISFLVLISVGVREFGAFTVAYVTYNLILSVNRGFVCHPLAIRFSGRSAQWSQGTATATGAAVAFGLLTGAVIVISGALAGGDVGSSLVAVGSLLPLLLLQDTFRFAFFAAGSPVRALWNDSIWSFGQFAGIGLVIGGGIDVGVATLIWIWAGARALAGLLGIVQASIYPEMGGLYLWVKNHGDLGLRLALESVLSRGTRRLALYAVGAIAGLEALGSFSGARVLFGPMNVLYMGMFAFAIPEGVRVAEHSLRRMARAVNVASVALVGISLALGIGLLAMPERWAVDVLGAKWPEIRGLVVPLAIVVAASGWVNAHRVGFRVLSAAKQSLRVEMVTGPASIVAAIVGAAYGGAFGAAVGLAAVDLVSAAYWHLQFRSQIAQRALQSKRVS